jgi:hypothetical protein
MMNNKDKMINAWYSKPIDTYAYRAPDTHPALFSFRPGKNTNGVAHPTSTLPEMPQKRALKSLK